MIYINKLNNILKFHISSFIFCCILGTLLHFAFNWSNNNIFIASLSAINESTWEHLKLAFFPMLLTTIFGYFYFGKNFSNYLCARLSAIIMAISFITISFYTYTGILGTNFAFLNITIFYISILLGELTSFKKLFSNNICRKIISFAILLIILFGFVIFTYFPPKINYFKDPITNSYGFFKN